MKGESAEETHLLKQMFEEAKKYLGSFSWCKGIDGSYFGLGVGGVIGRVAHPFARFSGKYSRAES